jgi:2-polyprenyl-3-methyl-5-hydroxy-6-metoxy-1,4-benzoquinol methylase
MMYVKGRTTSDCRVLDWGGGAGEFMTAIKPDVAEIVGTELNKDRIEFAAKQLGLKMMHPSSLMKEYESEYFDVITLFHVAEHFVNPVAQFEQILEFLDDDGLLIVEVPNLDDWLLKVSDEYQQFWYQRAHAQFYTSNSLLEMLKRVGYLGNIEFVQRYNLNNMFHWLRAGEPQLEEPGKVTCPYPSIQDNVYSQLLKSLNATDTMLISAMSGGG